MGRLSQIRARTDLNHFGVGLYDPKNSFNVGGAIRATGAFGGSFLAVQGNRWRNKGGNWKHMDTEGAHLRLPIYFDTPDLFSRLSYGMEPVVIERSEDAISLFDFNHPRSTLYIFGPEDGSIPSGFGEILNRYIPRVYIPSEYSLNLYTAVACVAYDRNLKLYKATGPIECPHCGHSNWRNGEEGYHCNACGKDWTNSEESA